MTEEYLKTLEDKINNKIAEKLALEQELESLHMVKLSKEVENLNLNGICNTLEQKRQELETANIVSLNTQSQYMAKIKDLKVELEHYHTSLKEYDLLKLKLAEIQSEIEGDNYTLEQLHKEKGSLDKEIREMKDEWGKLKREIDRLLTIESKLSTVEFNMSEVVRKIAELDAKKLEIADHLKEVEKQKAEFISNPLSIGYYIKFLQKRVDEGKLKNVFDEIKRAS